MHLLLVDDHAMFRQGLTFLLSDLQPDLSFAEASHCEEALACLADKPADLVLLDLNMPGSDRLSALVRVRQAHPATPVVVLSGEEDPALIQAALDAGASGFIPKSSSSQLLLAALQVILAGGVYLPAATLSQAPGETAPANGEAPSLSDRQLAVLLKAVQGVPNKIIAYDLGIAEGTVKTHLSAAYRALGVNNRIEAVFAAARLGLSAAPGERDDG